MRVTCNDIESKMKAIWPNLTRGNQYTLGNLWIHDALYWLPTQAKVEQLLLDSFMEQYRWTAQVFDCDTFTKVMCAFVAQERYRQMEEKKLSANELFEWAFFECGGTKYQGKRTHHALNGCITSDQGIILIEPQDDQIWKADHEKDYIYFAKF